MSRRKPDRDIIYTCIHIKCRRNPEHRIGRVVRQLGRDMLETGLERIDGPNGETKILAVCPVCQAAGHTDRPQVRWDRLTTMLDEMESNGKPFADYVVE